MVDAMGSGEDAAATFVLTVHTVAVDQGAENGK
jgi:hypothetical protein